MVIDDYYINGYWWLLVIILLMVINGFNKLFDLKLVNNHFIDQLLSFNCCILPIILHKNYLSYIMEKIVIDL